MLNNVKIQKNIRLSQKCVDDLAFLQSRLVDKNNKPLSTIGDVIEECVDFYVKHLEIPTGVESKLNALYEAFISFYRQYNDDRSNTESYQASMISLMGGGSSLLSTNKRPDTTGNYLIEDFDE